MKYHITFYISAPASGTTAETTNVGRGLDPPSPSIPPRTRTNRRRPGGPKPAGRDPPYVLNQIMHLVWLAIRPLVPG